MKISKSIVDQILGDLAEGTDPSTGEALPPTSAVNDIAVARALFRIKSEFAAPKNFPKREKMTDAQRREHNAKKNLPAKSHKAWDLETESSLGNDFDNGEIIEDLANKYQRTQLAIAARLFKLNKITKNIFDKHKK